ncbi:hypothetical protein GF338_09975 [candidate division WOR-3 bacterium]|nr:hypothetical protein [candidate division WOR-3 bacterium]
MKHKVYYNDKDKIAEAKYVGDISLDDTKKITGQLKKNLEGKSNRSIIADISEIPTLKLDRDVRTKMAEMGKELKLDKIAVLGATPMNRMLGKIVLTLFGKSKDTKFFETKEEAISWIKGKVRH